MAKGKQTNKKIERNKEGRNRETWSCLLICCPLQWFPFPSFYFLVSELRNSFLLLSASSGQHKLTYSREQQKSHLLVSVENHFNAHITWHRGYPQMDGDERFMLRVIFLSFWGAQTGIKVHCSRVRKSKVQFTFFSEFNYVRCPNWIENWIVRLPNVCLNRPGIPVQYS